MLYHELTIGGKDYHLRLNTRNIIKLEQQLGQNPLAIFGMGETLPTITQMVSILYCALLQYNHGITLEGAYDLFDEYLADGHTSTDFITEIIEIYKVSGLLDEGETKGKN